ncbi:nicotinate-nucleotide adenylyltransferase [Magnetospira thiophila]
MDHGRLRIGLLGGSFNPAHAGHLHISREALRRLDLDRIWWMVSPQNPLKDPQGMAPLADRLASARDMARDPRIVVTDIESHLGTRHTAVTLARLTRHFPRYRFVWLMGADNLIQIPRWRQWTQIFHRVPVAVFARSTYDLKALSGAAAKRFAQARIGEGAARHLAVQPLPAWTFLMIRRHPASATALRTQQGPHQTTDRKGNDR